MPQVISVETMRKSDAYTIANKTPSKELMRRAGEAIFRSAEWKAPVAVACGKGNNAGDGFVVASLLHKAGIPCEILLLEERFSEDGAYYFEACKALGVPWRLYAPGETLRAYGSILDCLLGTGFQGEVREPMASFIRAINESGAYVVSADINSGLNGDSGLGSLFVRSDLTVSIGTFKYGHFRGLAKEAMKEKVNCDIGIEIVGPSEWLEEA